MMPLMRTVAVRNAQVWRKTLANASTSARKSASSLSKPVGSFRASASRATRNSGSAVNSGLDRWQKSLETSDSTVIATTLAFIAFLILLTLLVVLLIRG